jgi:hypothetical protein
LSVTEETFFVDATRGSIVQFGKVDLLERGEAIAVVLVVVIVFDVAMYGGSIMKQNGSQ